ncbi:hypothetical protein GIB67_013954, partial [Kingdonia uniflora]
EAVPPPPIIDHQIDQITQDINGDVTISFSPKEISRLYLPRSLSSRGSMRNMPFHINHTSSRHSISGDRTIIDESKIQGIKIFDQQIPHVVYGDPSAHHRPENQENQEAEIERTTADDLFPLFDKYGKVVDIFIPKDRRTGDSRGFAFARYKYADEAQKAVERLDGKNVDGRNIMVQFAKYGPSAEPIRKGRVIEKFPKARGRSRSRSPRPRYRDEYRDTDYRRRSRSGSRGRYDRDRYHGRERDYHRRSRSRSASPDYGRGRGRSSAPPRRSLSPPRSSSPHRTPKRRRDEKSLSPRSASPSVSPRARSDSRSPSASLVGEGCQ